MTGDSAEVFVVSSGDPASSTALSRVLNGQSSEKLQVTPSRSRNHGSCLRQTGLVLRLTQQPGGDITVIY